jgi:GTP cyclohydrolase IIa
MDLQTLQSRLFADLAQFIGGRDGYVFFTRFDNMVAVTNGIDLEGHRRLQETVANRYPVTVSLSVGVDASPATALDMATAGLQQAGSAQDGDRREVLVGEPLARSTDEDVHIAHFDVDDATEKYTDRLNEFDSFIKIEQGYATLMRYLREQYGGLSFFVGGDNVIAVVPDLTAGQYRDAIAHVHETAGVELKVGVGRGRTAEPAGMDAKEALETCRHRGTSVELAVETPEANTD